MRHIALGRKQIKARKDVSVIPSVRLNDSKSLKNQEIFEVEEK